MHCTYAVVLTEVHTDEHDVREQVTFVQEALYVRGLLQVPHLAYLYLGWAQLVRPELDHGHTIAGRA